MSKLQTYKHELTGKVGQYSDAVAALFPELKQVVAAPEPVDAPAETPLVILDIPAPRGGMSVTKKKREVAA